MSAYAARARHILRSPDGVRRHLDAMALVRSLAATSELAPRRYAELAAALDRAEAEILTVARDAERREDDTTIDALHRVCTELAVVRQMVGHQMLAEGRDDGGAASRGR